MIRTVSGKKRVLAGAAAAALLVLVLGSSSAGTGPQPPPQEQPPQEVQKPKYDYMSTLLSRSTNPLGLKEDPATRRMLGQGAVAWAIRAGSRHVLD
jgi:hypothetical protein